MLQLYAVGCLLGTTSGHEHFQTGLARTAFVQCTTYIVCATVTQSMVLILCTVGAYGHGALPLTIVQPAMPPHAHLQPMVSNPDACMCGSQTDSSVLCHDLCQYNVRLPPEFCLQAVECTLQMPTSISCYRFQNK